MKIISIILCLAAFSSSIHAAAPSVGSISENQRFTLRSGSGFNAATLDDYEGGILILMMMTPWCPICQSHAQSVGSGLLDHFDSPSRGSLRGMNDNGVPIRSILLSTEEAASWDGVNESFSTTNGFQQWGLDANTRRLDARKLLGYYRGGFIQSSNLYDWGEDRRRIVVLNLVNGSPTHSFREIIINQNSYSSSDNAAARAAIDAVNPTGSSGEAKPEIEVRQPSKKALKNGRALRKFGSSTVRRNGKTLTFRIINTGDAILSDLSIKMTGKNSVDFLASSPGKTRLAPGKSTTFTVTFKPRTAGPRKAILQVNNNDPDDNPFAIRITGLGVR